MKLITSENPLQSRNKNILKNVFLQICFFLLTIISNLMLTLEKIMSHETLSDNDFSITLD